MPEYLLKKLVGAVRLTSCSKSLWERFAFHVFGASRLKLVKFFRTTHMRERCALPTSKFRLWERFALRISGAARLEFSRTPHLRERFALPISKFRL